MAVILGAATLPLSLTCGVAEALTPRVVRPLEAASLERAVNCFFAQSAAYGGESTRFALHSFITGEVRQLLAVPFPHAKRRQLLEYSAQLMHLLAGMTADAGRHPVARRQFHTALTLAQEAGSRNCRAVTLRAMSLHSMQYGSARNATDLAEAAVCAVGATGASATRAFVLVQRARVYANRGEPRRALTDLAAAESEHLKCVGTPGPFTSYPKAGMDFQRGEVLHALGHDSMAVSALREAARHRSPLQRKSYALTHARLAEALLARRDLEEACTHWHVFLDQYPCLQSATARQAMGNLHSALPRFGRQPAAASVLERARHIGRSGRRTPHHTLGSPVPSTFS